MARSVCGADGEYRRRSHSKYGLTPRGISIYPYANYGRPGTKYEKQAEQRFATHE